MLSTILIIDKRVELSTKYKKSLETKKTKVLIAKTLKDSMFIIPESEPDMIIISDSIEEELCDFCKKIRSLTFNTRPVIIALSKSADANDRIKVLDSGADDFLSEPVDIEEFKTRIKAHLRRDIESNLDSKTLLPNQKLVKKIIKRTLGLENQAILLVEINNLNEYKTVYTELASDKLIQTLIAISKSGLEESDFIGQLNENNFIIITNKYSAEKFAIYLTFAFDTIVSKFYSPEDIQRGYMILKGEKYAGMRVNFANISIGGITEGLNKNSSIEFLLENIKDIKNLAKNPNKSNYLFERIKLTGADSIFSTQQNKTIQIRENDYSLKYLLRTSLELQGYDIDENDSENTPSIIILDSGDNLEELQTLKEMKSSTKYLTTKFIVTTTTHDKTAILSAGADLYLPKPYEISELIAWVEYFLKIS